MLSKKDYAIIHLVFKNYHYIFEEKKFLDEHLRMNNIHNTQHFVNQCIPDLFFKNK